MGNYCIVRKEQGSRVRLLSIRGTFLFSRNPISRHYIIFNKNSYENIILDKNRMHETHIDSQMVIFKYPVFGDEKKLGIFGLWCFSKEGLMLF